MKQRAGAAPPRWGRINGRRVGLWIGAAAFVLQMLLWPVFAPAMAAGQTTPICTIDGVASVALDADGAPVKPDKARFAAEHCSLCQWAQALGAPPPAAMIAPPPVMAVAVSDPAPAGLLLADWFLSTLQPRGPPGRG